MSESIIRERIGFRSRGLMQGEVNEERQPDDIGAGNKAPVATIAAVVAIVAEHEISARGYDQLAILDVVAHLNPPIRIHARVGVEFGGKLIAKVILVRAFKNSEWFTLLLPVHIYHAVLQMDRGRRVHPPPA